MCSSSRKTTIAATMMMIGSVAGFAFVPKTVSSSNTELHMGLFDGVKQAFSAPPLERSTISSERETPIDRWMGWSVESESDKQKQADKAPDNFIDSMEKSNYIAVELEKPMGIIFEENDEEYGGIFIQSLKEDGACDKHGILKAGDQLVFVNTEKVSGLPFEQALSSIVDSAGTTTKLTIFRGTAENFYGPTGASQEWLDEFITSGGNPIVPAAGATTEKAEEKVEA